MHSRTGRRRRRPGPPGEGRLGCLAWAVALGVGLMIAWQAAPAKMSSVEFFDYIEEQAQFSGRTSGETLRKRILTKAEELEIPLDPKNLSVQKSTSRVRITCSYTVPLDFGFYTYDWKFDYEIDRPVFIV